MRAPTRFPTRRPRPARGFTLTELLVSTAITGILLTGVAAAVIGQQRAISSEHDVREATGGARGALTLLESRLAMAGYGLDPANAFLFGATEGADNSATNLGGDVLSFQFRDPMFGHKGRINGSTVEIANPLKADLPKGTRLLLLCPGAQRWAFAQVTSDPASKGASSFGISAVTGLPSDLSDSCFRPSGTGGADAVSVTRVRYQRFFLQDVVEGAETVRYLMLSEGLESGGAEQVVPVARGIEDFQVAYLMNRPGPDSPFRPGGAQAIANLPGNGCSGTATPWIRGAADDSAPCVPDTTATAPRLDERYDTANRYNAHPANVRAVRVSLTALGGKVESTKKLEAIDLENHPNVSTDSHFRLPMSTMVQVPNMLSRSVFNPTALGGG